MYLFLFKKIYNSAENLKIRNLDLDLYIWYNIPV